MADSIRFNWPSLEGRELEYIRTAVEAGHTSSSGAFTERASEMLAAAHGAPDVLLTTSCTAALEMSAMLLDLGPEDIVIVPSFTFVTTALAFARQGARLLFCDIEPVTLGLDPRHLATLMGPEVRAVVTVHYAGVGSDIAGIQAVLEQWPGVELIEDNAHGLFGSYRGLPLGTFGRFSTLSFHETKNFICGEGGALVLNRKEDVERAHIVLDKGTDRRAFALGQVDKYTWRDTGSSFGMSDVLAAYLVAQLEQHDHILGLRRRVFDRYWEALAPDAEDLGIRLPAIPEDREQAYHMFYLLFPDQTARDSVLEYMHAEEVNATFHYVPLHTSEGAKRFAAAESSCPVTASVSGRLLRLPFYNRLTDEDAGRVVAVLREAVRRRPGS